VKKILIIHNILWSHYKAAVFSELEKISSGHGYQIHVLQTALTGKGQKMLSEVDRSIHNYSYDLLFEESFENTSVASRLLKYIKCIREADYDAIVLPGYSDPAIWITTFYLVFSGETIIQTCDSTLYDRKRVWLKEYFKKQILKSASLVFCYGQKQIEYLQSLNLPIGKIHVRVQATNNQRIKTEHLRLSNSGVERESLMPAFLYVGRLSEEKNIDLLINAFSRLPENCLLTIVGDGPDKKRLEEVSHNLNLTERVFFAGSTSWVGVVKYYATVNVFVLPSLSEPWGLVVNEAMLCGLPVVISSHCGASGDLVHEGLNGFTFNPTSVDELEVCLMKFVDNPSLHSKMGDESLNIIKDFTPNQSALQMLSGFQKVLK
jgi:glycosyltransferase involved in cell wall biosynthesis